MGASPRRWGWHRLDPTWADRLVAEAGLPPRSLVLDVGAGEGVLTLALLAAGMRVVAVEAHPGRARTLRSATDGRAVVVEADAADLRLPRQPFHVVANPPFAVTSALLRRLVHPASRLVGGRLLVQGPAARRWAGPHAPARDRWAHRFELTVGARVPGRAFTPPPRVEVRVLGLERRGRARPGGAAG